MRYLFSFILLLIFITSCAQTKIQQTNNMPHILLSKKNTVTHFNGPIKSVKIAFTYKKQGLNPYQGYKIDNDLRGGNFEFYENGLLKTNTWYNFKMDTLNIFRPIVPKKSINLEYNEEDVKKSFQITPNIKYYRNVYSELLYYNPTYYVYQYDISNGLEKDLIEHIYIYIYDDKGRIKEKKYYLPSHLYDFTPYKAAKEEDLYYTISYHYNDKNQVIKQEIFPGYNEKSDYYPLYIYVLSIDMIIPENNGGKLEVHYQYDKQDRITQISLYDFNEDGTLLAAQSNYTYHSTKDFVEKSENYFEYNETAWAYPTKRWVSHFNEQGDIIKREFTKDYPEQSNSDTTTRFYEYEYDQYNNWIKCYLYLEGQKVKGDPTLIAERKIEYYE